MKIIKYSRISEINIGDVFISESINYIDSKTSGNHIVNQDMLYETFDIDKVVSAPEGIQYKVPKRNKFRSFIVLVIKMILFQLKHKNKIKSQIKDYDCVIIGGGNILSEKNGSDMFYRVCQIARIAIKQNKPVIVYAVGLGPFDFAYKNRLRKLINSSHSFSVRDEKSRLICLNSQNLNKEVNITVDPAFVVSDIYPKLEKGTDYIGVNFMNFKRLVPNSKFDIDEVVKNLKNIYNHYNLPFKIINTSFGEDISISSQIKSKMEMENIPVEIYNIRTLKDLPEAFSDLKFFIASRMHSSIFSMSYNIPTLIFSWHPKIEFLENHLFGEKKKMILLQSENFDFEQIKSKLDDYDRYIDLSQTITKQKETIYQDYEQIIKIA